MKQTLTATIKILFFLALGIFLVWLSVKDIEEDDKQKIQEAFSQADYLWVLLSMIMGILSHVSRAMRWNLLFEPLGHTPKLSNSFFAVMIGYFANFAAPRAGEVVRCGVLNKYEKIPLPRSIGTVMAERLIDVLCLLLLFIVMLATQYETIIGLAEKWIITPFKNKLQGLASSPAILLFAMLAIVAAIAAFLLLRKKMQGGMFAKAGGILTGLWEGLGTVKKVKRPLVFLLHTLFIWLMYFFMVYICFYCFPETSGLTLGNSLAVLILGSLGIIFIPGGIGAYQLLVSEALISFGIIKSTAVAFAWIVWTSQFVLLMLAGLASLIAVAALNKK